jgi:hypothetical protein
MKRFCNLTLFIMSVAAAGCSQSGGAHVVPTVTFVAADAGETAEVESSTDSVDMGEPGSFNGKVVLVGSQSPLPPLIAMGADVKDKEVCAAVDVPDERIVLGESNGVANVFIYLAKAPKGGKELITPEEPYLFDQKNCRFLPHCVVLPIGQTVKVLSDDTVAHNTHTYPNKNQSVNSGVAPGDREGKLEIVYRKAEAQPLSVKCDYHTWMTAYHLPLDHPYGTETDANGGYTIPHLPPGKYSFVVWHEAADGNFVERKLPVEIASGVATTMEIAFPAEKLKLK